MTTQEIREVALELLVHLEQCKLDPSEQVMVAGLLLGMCTIEMTNDKAQTELADKPL